jgi:hypothetical protein
VIKLNDELNKLKEELQNIDSIIEWEPALWSKHVSQGIFLSFFITD